jgi:hypothetical protein
MDQTIATAVNKEKISVMQMLLKCLPFGERGAKEHESTISAVRLQLSVNDVKGCRKVALKGLYGDHELISTFIENFRRLTILLVENQTKNAKPRSVRKNVVA